MFHSIFWSLVRSVYFFSFSISLISFISWITEKSSKELMRVAVNQTPENKYHTGVKNSKE